MNGLKVFISYAEKQLELAKNLQSWHTELAGIEAFLAKNCINGGDDFTLSIIEGIRKSDVFLCILSKEYKKSEYCDQELGIAIALDKMIIPIKYKVNPYGFIDHSNALSYTSTKEDEAESLFYEVIGSVTNSNKKYKNIKNKLTNSMVSKLLSCNEYSKINKIALLLIPCIDVMSKSQRSKILSAFKKVYILNRAINMKSLVASIKKI